MWIDTPSTAIEAWNAAANHYSKEVLEDLSCRFEPPSPLTRWDTPLFRVCPVKEAQSETLAPVNSYEELPLSEIWESLTVVKTQAKHLAINPPVCESGCVEA